MGCIHDTVLLYFRIIPRRFGVLLCVHDARYNACYGADEPLLDGWMDQWMREV